MDMAPSGSSPGQSGGAACSRAPTDTRAEFGSGFIQKLKNRRIPVLEVQKFSMVSGPKNSICCPESLSTDSLKSRVFRAGGWTLVGYIVGLVLRLAGTLVLTRLFTPEIFGIMAVAMAFHLVITLLADVG